MALLDSMLAAKKPLLVYGGVLPVDAVVQACKNLHGSIESIDLRRDAWRAEDIEAKVAGRPVVLLVASTLPASVLSGIGRLSASRAPVVVLSPTDKPEPALWELFVLRLAADAAFDPAAGDTP